MTDTFIKTPKILVGTQAQVESEMTANDIGFATDIRFYNATETDTLLASKQPIGDYATNEALSSGLATKQPVGDYATNSALTGGLATKADIDSVANLALPSSRFIDLTLPASEGNYYAPADGYFYVQKNSTSGSTSLEYLNIYNRTAGNIAMTITNAKSAGAVVQAWVLARKGDRIQPVYNLGGTTNLCRFIYAQSAQ